MSYNNRMERVARILELELDQRFFIDKVGNRMYRLTKAGLQTSHNQGKWEEVTDASLERIITGEYTILKIPFVPQEGEKYWYADFGITNYLSVEKKVWDGDVADYKNLADNNCFRTHKEVVNAVNLQERVANMKSSNFKAGDTLLEIENTGNDNFSFTPYKICKIGRKFVYIDKRFGSPQPVEIDSINKSIPLRGINRGYCTSKEEFYKYIKATEMAITLEKKLNYSYLLTLGYSKLEELYKKHVDEEA